MRPLSSGGSHIFDRSGISLLETLIVLSLIAVIATGIGLNLVGKRGKADLDNTTKLIVGALREAQSRAIAQASSTKWGVYMYHPASGRSYFELVTISGFQQASFGERLPLPETLDFDTSTLGTINPGVYAGAIFFTEIYGATNSTTVHIVIKDNRALSSTIHIASSGAISF